MYSRPIGRVLLHDMSLGNGVRVFVVTTDTTSIFFCIGDDNLSILCSRLHILLLKPSR